MIFSIMDNFDGVCLLEQGLHIPLLERVHKRNRVSTAFWDWDSITSNGTVLEGYFPISNRYLQPSDHQST